MHQIYNGGGDQSVWPRLPSSPTQLRTTPDLCKTSVELPLEPTKTFHTCDWLNWRNMAIFLGLVSAGSLAIGVADVILAYQRYMVGMNCATTTTLPVCYPSNLVYTWVASGIWGSVLPFIIALLALRKSPTNKTPIKRSHYDVLCILAAFLFTPAMIILSSLEAAKQYPVYYQQQGDQAKIALPIVVVLLAFIEHVILLIELLLSCCCRSSVEQTVSMRRTQPTIRTPTVRQPLAATTNTLELPYQPVGGRQSQMYPVSYGGLSNNYSFYNGSGGMGGRPTYINSYNPSFSQLGQVTPGQSGFSPNPAYSLHLSGGATN